MKTLIINNLASALGQGAIFDLVRLLSKDGDEVVVRSTDGTTDIRELLFDADRFDLVVASGGDGTIATIAYQLADTGIPILPFPSGATNMIANNTWLPNETHALAKLAREGETLDFDLGEIEIDGGTYGFGVVAGCGYDALVVRDAKPTRKLFGPAAYFGAAISNVTPTHARITLTIDGERIETEGVGVLIVNFSKVELDLSVASENQPRDGMLDIIVLNSDNVLTLLPAIGDAFLDKGSQMAKRKGIETYRGSEIIVETDPPLPIEYDGEDIERTTPFAVRILPHAMRLFTSAEGHKLFGENEE